MDDVRVVSVVRCECGEAGHARALLRPAGGGRGLRVRVDHRTARGLVAELHQTACAEAPLIDLLAAALQAGGSALTGVTLIRERDEGAMAAALRFNQDGTERVAPALIATALLIACRLQLPIRIEDREASPAELPGAVAAFLRGLDLSALEQP